MTFIACNFDDAVEPQPASAGRYNLQITGCDVAKTGADSKVPGSPQFKVSIGFQDDPRVPNIMQYISLPNEQDDAAKANFKVLLLKRFLHLFNVKYDPKGIDVEQMAMNMVGSVANVEVQLTEPDPKNGNVYNRIIVPRLDKEDPAPQRAGQRKR